jgi:ribonuclease HI
MVLLRHHFMHADIQYIVKIKPSPRLMDDILGWAPMKNGLFTVKSAYWLAMEERQRPFIGTTSRAPDGHRAIWKALWGCPAPQKVRIFAWKLATNALATWDNKHKRNMETSNICVLCGVECEDNYHAFCRCPLAINLWHVMSEVWELPDPLTIPNVGSEWVLHLLHGKTELERLRIMMLLWRIWHVRNEVVHHKPPPPAEASRRFLCSYVDSLLTIKYYPHDDGVKGKAPADQQAISKVAQNHVAAGPSAAKERWTRPPAGWGKLNVDGSYVEATKEGGAGTILRDEAGSIVFSSCRYIPSCSSPLEAELAACLEGCTLALEWCTTPFIVELDCSHAVRMINNVVEERSEQTFMVKEIHHLLRERLESKVVGIRREQNLVSDALAKMARTDRTTAVWLRSGPSLIPRLCSEDCNSGV